MTELEMMKFAAKAAGYVVEEILCNGSAWVHRSDAEKNEFGEYFGFQWHPRLYSRDSFALMIALEMRVAAHCNQEMASAGDIYMRAPVQVVEWGADREAAVRLAIFMLAVEIGKVAP